MTNIAKIFTVAVALVVGTGAISGIALASVDHTFYPDRLENPKLSLPSPGVGSGIPAPYRIGDQDQRAKRLPSVTWSGERYPCPLSDRQLRRWGALGQLV